MLSDLEDNDLLLVGKIVGVHGVNGALKVFSYCESDSIFKSNRVVYIKDFAKNEKICKLLWANPYKRIIRVGFEKVVDRNAAETLVGSDIFIKKSLEELEEGTFYWFELIGLLVFTLNDKFLGIIDSIFPTGSNDVYVVCGHKNNRETLVPAIDSVVVEVDVKKNIMRVDLPEGLM